MYRPASWCYYQYLVLSLVLQRVFCGFLDAIPALGASVPGIESDTPSPEEECMVMIERSFPGFLNDDYVISALRRIRGNDTKPADAHSRSKRSVDIAASVEPLIDQLKDLYKKGWHKRKRHRKNVKKNEERINHFLMPYGRGLNYKFYNITELIYAEVQESVFKMVMLRKDIRDSFRKRFTSGRSHHYSLTNQDVPRRDFYDHYARAVDGFNAAARTFDKAAHLRRRALRYLHKLRNFRDNWRRKNLTLRLHDLDRKSIHAMTIAWRARLLRYYVRRDYRRIKALADVIGTHIKKFKRRVENGKRFTGYRARRSQKLMDQKLQRQLGIFRNLKYDMMKHLGESSHTMTFLGRLVSEAKSYASALKAEVGRLKTFTTMYTSKQIPSKVHQYMKELSYIPDNITAAHNIISSANLSLPTSSLTWLCPPLPTEPPVTLPVTHPTPQEGSGDMVLLDAADPGDLYFEEQNDQDVLKTTKYSATNEGSGAVIEENFLIHTENVNKSEFHGIFAPVTPAPTEVITPVTHVLYGADDEASGDEEASGDGSRTGTRKVPDDRPVICRKKLISIDTTAHLLYKWRRRLLMDRHTQEERLYSGKYNHRIGEMKMRQSYADRLMEIEDTTRPILAEMVMIVVNETDEMVALQKTTESGNKARSALEKINALPVIQPVPEIKRYQILLQEAANKIPNVKQDVEQISDDTSKLRKLLDSVDLKALVNKVVHNTEHTAKFQKDVSDGISKLRMNIREAYSQVASIKRSAVIDKEKTVSLSPWFLTQSNSDMISVSIDVRTNSTQGTILRMKEKQYKMGHSAYQMTLSIEDSKPSLMWLYHESHRHLTTDRVVADGTWHRLRIDRIGATLKLSERPLTGDSEIMSKIWLPPDASSQPLPPYMHIGQVDYYEDSIAGCVMDFTINSFLLPLPESGRPWTKCQDKEPEFIYTGSGQLDELLITTQVPGFECLSYTDETVPYALTLDSDNLQSFSFSFKSDSDRSILMSYYAAANHYLLVYMYGGRLWVNGRTKAGYFRQYCRKPSATLGKWHSVKFHKLDYWVAFYLDNEKCDYVGGKAIDTDSSSTSRLVLGSMGSSSPLSNLKWLKPFRGWIKQFIANDKIVLFKDNAWAQECPVM